MVSDSSAAFGKGLGDVKISAASGVTPNADNSSVSAGEPVSQEFLGAGHQSTSQVPEAGSPANTDDWFQSSGESWGHPKPPPLSPYIPRPASTPPAPA